MKPKAILKMALDIIMTILMLVLMAYHITGRQAHEVLGIILFFLFILHHILNINWYKGLRKGKYSIFRILNTTVNILLSIIMVCMIASGLMLSFLNLAAVGRPLHMVSTYWGFLLISIHLGLHWGMVMGMAKRMVKNKLSSKSGMVISRLLAGIISLRGIYAFFSRRMWEKLFLVVEFSFFDYDAPVWIFFIDYIAIMGLFACVSYYSIKGLRKKPLRLE